MTSTLPLADNASALSAALPLLSMQQICPQNPELSIAPIISRYQQLSRVLCKQSGCEIETFLIDKSVYAFSKDLELLKNLLKTFQRQARFVRHVLTAYGLLHTAMQEKSRPEDISKTNEAQKQKMEEWTDLRDTDFQDFLNKAVRDLTTESVELSKLCRTLRKVPAVPLSSAISTGSLQSHGGRSVSASPVEGLTNSQLPSAVPSPSSIRVTPVPFDVQQQMLTMAFPALQNAYLQKHQECESVATKCEETKAQLTLEKNNLEQSRKECSRLRQEHKEISLQLQTALETNKKLNAGMLLAKKTQQTQFNNASIAVGASTAAALTTLSPSDAMHDALQGMCVNCLIWCEQAPLLDMKRMPGTIQAAHPLLQPFLYALYTQYTLRERKGIESGGEAELLRGWKVEAPEFHWTGELHDDDTHQKHKMCVGRRNLGDCVEGGQQDQSPSF